MGEYSEARKKLKEDDNAKVELEDLNDKQQDAIMNRLSGDSWYQAMKQAGYQESYARNPHDFRNQPSVKAYFRGARRRFREKHIYEAIELAGKKLTDRLASGEIYGALVSLIKLTLKYGNLEPADKAEVQVNGDEGGASFDLSKLYEILDEDLAEKIINQLQEEEG
uniref:Terminase small subunit n=1 Tax=uncultured organism TaxID=155900 RepID=M1PVD5_9ZZZZ|nr:hypothetical protein FLSS-17_0007 [uncultured organism]